MACAPGGSTDTAPRIPAASALASPATVPSPPRQQHAPPTSAPANAATTAPGPPTVADEPGASNALGEAAAGGEAGAGNCGESSPLAWPWCLVGEPCDRVPSTAPADLVEICGTDGRIAGIWLPIDAAPPAVRKADAGRRRVVAEVNGKRPVQRATVARIGPYLEVRVTACGQCRRVMGVAFVLRPGAMAAESLVRLQDMVHVPSHPLLRTEGAWARALRDVARRGDP